MPETQVNRKNLGPLNITDLDIGEDGLSLSVIGQSGAFSNQVPQWDDTLQRWVAASLPAGSTFVDNEELAGIKNGQNLEFTLVHFPAPPNSIQLFRNGILMRQGVGHDFTVNNKTVTFRTAPEPNDALLVWYRR